MLSFLGVILGLSFTNKKKSFKKITLFKVTQVPPLIHLSQLSYFLFHKTVYLVYLLKTLEAHEVHERVVIPLASLNDLSKLSSCVFILMDLDFTVKFYSGFKYGLDLICFNSY